MFNKIFACVLFVVHLFKKAYSIENVVDVYAVEGETITLKCENNAIDHWENINNRGFIIYCKELRDHISPSARLKLTEECNLQIQILTHDYSVTYRCIISGEVPLSKDFNIIILKPPSKMKVLEANMTEIVLGIEGQQLTLTCNVNSGKPEETIFWIKNETVVSSGGPGSLRYTFIPQQEDNLQNYTCKANNSLNSVPLEESVQLRLTLIPRISVHMKVVCFQKNMTASLHCSETSGWPVNSYNWIYNEAEIIETSNELMLTSLNKSDDGRYTCIAKNDAGSDNASLVVQHDNLCQQRKLPTIHLYSDKTSIYISWKRGNISIEKQLFEIEYRQQDSNRWRMLSTNNKKQMVHSFEINELIPSTEYIIRMSMNGSRGYIVADEYRIKTKGIDTDEFPTKYIVLAVAFTAVVVFGTAFLIKRLIGNRQQADDEEVQQQVEDMNGTAATNQLYHSMSDLLAQPGASGRDTDVHSSFERYGIPSSNHKVSYNLRVNTTTAEKNHRNSNGSFNRDKSPGLAADLKISKRLKYVEVLFDPFPIGHKFVIRGSENRTPYAHIDFDAHAEPLSSSSENSSTCGLEISDDENKNDDVE
ncbi:netrin receptor DCC-like isoform X1 [Mytilus californianus]|uniref:netrin receptor DCC-like isoform X1 n=1 Tax=Mytilus californianus TaxID=6549 RepID=UPI002246D440|nr:netrin receptor DCC-like isoform X1 [Mytilus californianus]